MSRLFIQMQLLYFEQVFLIAQSMGKLNFRMML